MSTSLKTSSPVLFRLTTWGVYATLLTPLIFWDQVMFPFIFPKVIYFRVLVEILFTLYILLWMRDKNFAPRIGWLGCAVWLYIGVLCISGIFGENPYQSFFSTVMRGDGILTYFHLGMFFVVLSGLLKTREQWFSLFSFFLLLVLMENAIAFGQLLHLPWLKTFGTDRTNGTLGNPAYYASFILFGIWLSVFILASRKLQTAKTQKWLNIVCVLNIVLGMLTLFFTENRGGTLALALGAFFFFAIVGMTHVKKYFQPKYLVTALVVVGIFTLAALLAPEGSIIKKLTHYPLRDITIANRLISWEIGWMGFTEKPILGHGGENFYVVFDKHFRPELIRDSGSFSWYDRAHNIIIEILVASGIVGLLSYAAIFWFAFRAVTNAGLAPLQKISLASLLLTYLVQNIFLFDTISTLVVFYAIAAYLQYESAFSKFFFEKAAAKLHDAMTKTKRTVLGYSTSIGIATFAGIYLFNAEPLSATYYSSQVFLDTTHSAEQTYKNFQKAFYASPPNNQELRQSLGNHLIYKLRSGESIDDNRVLIIFALEELEKSAHADPRNVQTRLILAELARMVSTANPVLLSMAEQYAQEALELSPKRYQVFFSLGKIRFAQNRHNEAREYFQEALELYPDFIPANWNIAISYILEENYDVAEQTLEKIKKQDDFFIYQKQNIELLSGAYREKNRLDKIIELYEGAVRQYEDALEKDFEKTIASFPDNAWYYQKLAELYRETGQNNNTETVLGRIEFLQIQMPK